MGKVHRFPDAAAAPGRRSVLPRQAMPAVACPFCDSDDTEPASIYGCHMMTAQYYCRSCRSMFDWVRHEPLGPEPE